MEMRMSAYMRTQTTGESAEIALSVAAPVAELNLLASALRNVLALAWHEPRPVNEIRPVYEIPRSMKSDQSMKKLMKYIQRMKFSLKTTPA
jgi:hypothetical protein